MLCLLLSGLQTSMTIYSSEIKYIDKHHGRNIFLFLWSWGLNCSIRGQVGSRDKGENTGGNTSITHSFSVIRFTIAMNAPISKNNIHTNYLHSCLRSDHFHGGIMLVNSCSIYRSYQTLYIMYSIVTIQFFLIFFFHECWILSLYFDLVNFGSNTFLSELQIQKYTFHILK